jgi:hypothetical protein
MDYALLLDHEVQNCQPFTEINGFIIQAVHDTA